jgi:hypothetical protein
MALLAFFVPLAYWEEKTVVFSEIVRAFIPT